MASARTLPAAISYFAIVFGAGFVLGAGRTLLLAPLIGQTGAVLAELPVMLAISWWAARQEMRRWQIADSSAAAAMGLIAFALLMAAELALAVTLGGLSARQWLAGLWTTPGLLGLGGQIVFAMLPWRLTGG